MVVFSRLWKILSGVNPVTGVFVYTTYRCMCIYISNIFISKMYSYISRQTFIVIWLYFNYSINCNLRLLLCQICQCIKRSPVRMASLSHSKFSNLSSSDNGKKLWLLWSQFLCFLFHHFHEKWVCPCVDLKLRSRGGSGKKTQTHITKRKGNVFKSVLEISHSSCFLPHLPISMAKTTPAIRDLTTVEEYETAQKSWPCRCWDSALDLRTVPPSPPPKHFPAGEHVASEKGTKSIHLF